MKLRPYQVDAASAIKAEWDKGNNRTLLVLPTGCGKTIVFCKVSEDQVRQGERVLILAHRGELLQQAADKMMAATGLGCSLEKAESTSIGEWYRIVVGSVQTLSRPNRLKLFAKDYFTKIIVDEAHHVLSPSYLTIFEHFSEAQVLGVTATPDRGDLRSLGAFFDSLAFEYTLPRAIKDGFLVPIRAQTIPIKIEMAGVSMTAGDYQAADVGNALDPYLEQIAQEIATRCKNRKTVVFTPLIATSIKLQAYLIASGVKAVEVNGESPDRKEIIEAFDKHGPGIVLLNSMLLTEGWDCDSVDCVCVLRATKVRGLYCQMVGRGTRILTGLIDGLTTALERIAAIAGSAKKDLLLLDFLWHTVKHELCRPASLVAEDEEVEKRMTEKTEAASNPGESVDLMEIEIDAQAETIKAREESLAEKLLKLRNKKAKLVDPLQYEMSIQDIDLVNYKPSFGWEAEPPSVDQREKLFKLGLSTEAVDTAGKAERLIKSINQRIESNLSSPKQIRFLEGRGFQHVGKWSMPEAKGMVDRIAANSWRTPYAVNPKTYQPTKKETV